MSNLKPKRWSQSLTKFEQWSLTREFLQHCLTEKQTGYFQSGRLREVVAYERVDCIVLLSNQDIIQDNEPS